MVIATMKHCNSIVAQFKIGSYSIINYRTSNTIVQEIYVLENFVRDIFIFVVTDGLCISFNIHLIFICLIS